jgi:hypothetical protein
VQAADDVLFYFDYRQGIHRFDGKVWEEIFKGLAPRGP